MKLAAQRFAKLLWPVFGLCIVSYAILLSFTVVDGTLFPDPLKNYYTLLFIKEVGLAKAFADSGGADPEKMKQYALVLWQDGKIEQAEPLLRNLWFEHKGDNHTTYDTSFVEDGLNLAGLYLDRGSNGLAAMTYARLIEYDKAHLSPNDPRLGRDINNLALCYLQTAEATSEWKERKEWLEKSIEESKKAERIFRSSPKSEPQLVCNLQNQVVTYSELGEDDKALDLNEIVDEKLNSWSRQKYEMISATKGDEQK